MGDAEDAEEDPADGDGEENEESKEDKKKPVDLMAGDDTYEPISAVIRLKIPKVAVEPEMDEDGNEIEVEINESDLEDIPFEDKCLQVVTQLED